MLAGYLLSIVLIPAVISQRKALIISTLLSCALLVAALLTSGWTSVVLFSLLGFSESVMWPAIWPLALHGLGRHTKTGGAILVMMIVGGAIMLPLMGVFADSIHSAKWGYLIMVPCYLYILYFAVSGYRVKA
jgi:fucose permease